ncbi:MAG: cytochrome c peroxidase [Bacteroidota bacterium]
MRKVIYLILPAFIFLCSAFAQESDTPFSVPAGWPEPAYDFSSNPLRKPVIELGKALFFDPVLSRDNTISCASCHLPQTGFSHTDHDLSHGIENRIGTRNSPALVNLAWSRSFMWDGAVHNLDMQALAPITNPDEMDESMPKVIAKLQALPAYRSQFAKAFADSQVTGEHALKALSQYMLTLISCRAKYDLVQNGEAVFNEYEQRGYSLFKRHCASCHTEPLFTNNSFETIGLPPDTSLHDTGRMKITGKPADLHKYKVPSLRNIEVTYPYMHDGRFKSLQMVLFHYSSGIEKSNNLPRRLKGGLPLNEENKRDLIAFLKTLTDETFLHNPNYLPN